MHSIAVSKKDAQIAKHLPRDCWDVVQKFNLDIICNQAPASAVLYMKDKGQISLR